MESYYVTGILLGWNDEKSSGHRQWSWLNNNVSIFNATELYT
jgi:hypothetical protein